MKAAPAYDPVPALASELSLPRPGVAAVVKLLTEGSTVPFIARYRKEVTGGLDEVQIRAIEERRAYILELEDRRAAILASVAEQGKLTPELEKKLLAASTKALLEDLYLPYKPKRRTRATIARERGLQPLADKILAQEKGEKPLEAARAFVSAEKEVPDEAAALAGARDIVAEAVAEDAGVRTLVRQVFKERGELSSSAVPEKTQERTKFEQYYDFKEPVAQIPSHRYLAVRRGEHEGVLKVGIVAPPEACLPGIEAAMKLDPSSPFAGELRTAVADALQRLLAPSVETDVRLDLKMRADREAVEVFASNLKSLLLAAPLGERGVIGIDPGLRTGCKCVAVDATGRFLDHVTIYPSQGPHKLEEAKHALLAFVARYTPMAIAIGNGTAGRETEAFVKHLLAETQIKEVIVVSVNEAGASVYSASDVAREEFPALDVTVRGAISIARRLQDPLAELVKIDPKAIGVGQYQHDVHQPLLAKKLDEVVESCVNHVGVELNTASASLLARVAGIGPALAKKIVHHKETHGAFAGRDDLLSVSGLGPKTFEQAAGFLRVQKGKHPLDASAVHPERYGLVERIAKDLGVEVKALVGNGEQVKRIDVSRYVGEGVGEPTLRDIVAELQKPGRDPRQSFEPPKFRDDVMNLEDLKPGMELEGVVTNVTAFGAFVDVGVHQDGLVHISQLADRFVKEASEVVSAGDRLKVRVLEVDLERRRIALSAKQGGGQAPRRDGGERTQAKGSGDSQGHSQGHSQNRPKGGQGRPPQKPVAKFSNNPFANLRKPS